MKITVEVVYTMSVLLAPCAGYIDGVARHLLLQCGVNTCA
jgi:hypothetical protein